MVLKSKIPPPDKLPAFRGKAPLTESGICELQRKLLSQEANERRSASWELRLAAESGANVISPSIASTMRIDKSPLTRQNLIMAILHCCEHGHDITESFTAIGLVLKSNDLTARHSAALILARHANDGGDIGPFLSQTAALLRSIAANTRHVASSALKGYASQGPEQAHRVIVAVERSRDELSHDVRVHCMEIIRDA